jgi:hypothetical protein
MQEGIIAPVSNILNGNVPEKERNLMGMEYIGEKRKDNN